MVGLPGTGLGGIFYMFLVIWMGARETWLLAIGASSRSRWSNITRLTILAACIAGALLLEGWLLMELDDWLLQNGFATFPDAGTRNLALKALTPALAAAPFVILGVLLGGLHFVRLLRRRSKASMVALEIAIKE